ncbi:MAG: pilus assembly protein PilM, partial [Deltaproteobacteria bacterium]
NTVPVIAFSSKKSEIDGLMAFFKDASLEVRVIEAVPTALFAAFDLNNIWEDGVNYSMVDIGASKTTLVILKNKRLMFTREISFGGRDLTASIAGGLNKEESVAEEYKVTYGLNPPEGQGNEAGRLITGPLTELCRELRRSFDYYQAQFREGSVSKIFLCGGTARLKGIEGFITETLGIQSFVDDPFRKINIPGSFDKEKLRLIAPCMSIAAGLASRT